MDTSGHHVSFEFGSKILLQRLQQGLKPLVRIEVRKWKRKAHSVAILVRLEAGDAWAPVISTTKAMTSTHSRDWDATALMLWEIATGADSSQRRHAYLSQHLSHRMFTYEVEVTEVARKGDLG